MKFIEGSAEDFKISNKKHRNPEQIAVFILSD